MPRFLLTSRSRLGAFRRGTSGNIGIIFALSLVPLVGLVGLGVDYGVALSVKAKLDNAADAAAIAAVATAKAYVAANPTDPNLDADARAAGQAQAARAFTVNAGSLPFAAVPTPAIVMPPRSGQTYSAAVSYQTQSINNFGRLFSQPNTTISGNTAASADIPSYLDFYLLVDVSGSMGLPTDVNVAQRFASSNNDMSSSYPYGCQFACHFPGYNGWSLAVTNHINLRSDSVNSAVCSLVQRAQQQLVPNQYRIGVYPFITQMATLVGITTNLNAVWNQVCTATSPTTFTSLLDPGSTELYVGNDPSTGTGSGGTHFETLFPKVQSTISPYGNGSSQSQSRPFVFLVTDGMENNQHFYTWANNKYNYPGNPSMFWGYPSANWDGSQSALMDPTLCTAVKNAGATISVLYIPYNFIPTIQNGSGIAAENNKVNGLTAASSNGSPSPLETSLQGCASTGFYYRANTAADITNSLNAMFNQALQMAHLLR